MFRCPRLFALVAVTATVIVSPLAAQNADVHGTWTAELRDGQLFLQVRTSPPADWNGDRWRGDWNMGQSLPIDEVGGLPRNDNQFSVSNVKFELRREAGTLAFDGAFRDGRGAGLFTFAPRVFAVSRSNVTVSSGDNSVLSMPRGRSSGVIVAKFQVAPWKSGTFHGVRATFQDSAFGDACTANKPRLTATTATTECLAIVDLRSTQGTP